MEISHWAATNLRWNFHDSLVCSAVGSGSRLSVIATQLQRCSKEDVALQKMKCWFCSFIELLHLCCPGWAEVQSELTRHLPQPRCLYKVFGHSLLLPILWNERKCHIQRSLKNGVLSSAVLRAAEVYKLLKLLLLAYLATKLSSPMVLNLLFAKFWLWLQLGPFTESMWMQFTCGKRG